MKFGVAAYGENSTHSEIAEECYSHSIKTVELRYDERFNSKEVRRIKDFDLDLSIHCHKNLRLDYSMIRFILNSPKFYFTKSHIKNIENGFSVAEKLEATHYVMHGGIFPKGYFRFKRLKRRDKFVDAFIKTFKPLFIKAKDTGIRVVLENLTKGNLFSDYSDIMNIQNEHPWLGFCFDFAHSELTHQTDFLKKLKIDHMHVSDNNLITDSHLILGKGKIELIKLKEILEKQKFNGKILAECSDVKDAIRSFEYLKKNYK